MKLGLTATGMGARGKNFYLVDAITLVGPAERIGEKVDEWKQAGADTLILSGPSCEVVRTIAEISL